MFYFTHTLFISTDLDPLMSSVCGNEALLLVGWSVGVKDFDFEVSPIITATPKAIGGNIQPGPISCYCRSSTEDFTCDWLQCRFDTDIITSTLLYLYEHTHTDALTLRSFEVRLNQQY